MGAGLPLEVTFDGGARTLDGRRVAGAGAVLWAWDIAVGSMVRLAEVSVALPGETSAQLAEARGCALVLSLLRMVAGRGRRARVIGDILAVVRYGAEQGRLRRAVPDALIVSPSPPASPTAGRPAGTRSSAASTWGADALATEGVFRAAGLAGLGHPGEDVSISWPGDVRAARPGA